MAKRRKSAPKTKTRIRTITRRAGSVVRRGASRAVSAAKNNKALLMMAGSAVVFGWLKGKVEKAKSEGKTGTLAVIPHIDALGVPMTYGLAAFIASNFVKGSTAEILKNVGVGGIAIGLSDLGKNIAKSPSGQVNLSFVAGEDSVSGLPGMPGMMPGMNAGNPSNVTIPASMYQALLNTAGSAMAGDELEGDELEGDELEGDELEGDELEGDVIDGDDELEGDLDGEYDL